MIASKEELFSKEKGANFDFSIPEKLDYEEKDSLIFSFFNAPITNKIPSKNVSLEYIYEAIKGDSFNEVTNKLRSITNHEEAKKYKSLNFKYVTFSGTFTMRGTQNLIKRSLFICCDLDHIGDPNTIRKVIEHIINKLPPRLMFISPSGDGLKIVYAINLGKGTHLQYFRALQKFFKDEIGFETDSSGSDISRACFLPSDPEVYFNNRSEKLNEAFLKTFLPSDFNIGLTQDELSSRSQSIASEPEIIIRNLVTWLNKNETFKVGNRNTYISRLAFACNRYGLSENVAVNQLVGFAETGFTENEIRSICKSVYKHTEWHGIVSFNENEPYDYQKPDRYNMTRDETLSDQALQGTPNLPIAGFPFHIQALIKECVRVYGMPQDFWAASIIQATAIAMGSSFEIKDKFNNGAVLWIAIVSPSGIGKSEPIDFALKPIYTKDAEAEKIYKNKLREYDSIMALSPKERKLQNIDTPERPKQIQYIAVDSTPEGLTEAHYENPKGIAIIREELVGWIKDFGRYAKSGEVQNMLSSWSEKFFKLTRKGNNTASIEKPFIPVIGGIQPSKLYELAKDGRTFDGFTQRFMFAFPDICTKPEYQLELLGQDYTNHYHAYINKLLDLPAGRNPIRLSKDAKEVYKDFYNHNVALTNAETNDYVRSAYQKLEIIVLRLALILHVSNHVDDELYQNPIQPKTMQDAIEQAEYFRITAIKVYRYFSNTSSETEKFTDQGIAEYLLKTKKVSKSKIADVLGTSRSQVDRLLKKKVIDTSLE